MLELVFYLFFSFIKSSYFLYLYLCLYFLSSLFLFLLIFYLFSLLGFFPLFSFYLTFYILFFTSFPILTSFHRFTFSFFLSFHFSLLLSFHFWFSSFYFLGPFHTERATPAPALMCGPTQTNFYCFQRSLSHGADAGHRPHAGDMQRGLPLGWSRACTHEKVLCNIASNGCLHTEREKPALTDSFNDTQWKLAIKTGDKNKYVNAGGGFSSHHVKRIN